MPSDADNLRTIKSLAFSQLAALRSAPKPSYSIDGQQVSWESYVASLERTIDWCDQKLSGEEPFEFVTRGCT